MATYRIKSNEREYTASVVDRPGGGATVTIDGQSFEVEVAAVGGAAVAPATPRPAAPVPAVSAPRAPQAPSMAAPGEIVAPIPGKILSLKVKVGDAVSANDVLLVLEAMKMENNVPSPLSGTVKEIAVSEGAEVSTGQMLMRIE